MVGGQFGSEGKGKISAVITLQEQIDICVRCGGPNSGHSFELPNGELILLRQLPTGFIRPQTRLLIPAGGLVDLAVLRAEIEALGLNHYRVGIDRNAMVITQEDKDRERRSGLSERLSSTLCGVGSAVARRALREANVGLASDAANLEGWLRPLITNVSAEVNSAHDTGKSILIEGTQGSGLSLYHSPFYPKTTSRDTDAAGFIGEVGISPRLVSEIVVVFRTFPIRVAGQQSGPLQDEISWEQIEAESGWPNPLSEYTTVTKRLRRVARFDWEQASRAIALNRPTRLAVNFIDYLGVENRQALTHEGLNPEAKRFLTRLEEFKVRLAYIGTGPKLRNTILRGNDAPARPAMHDTASALNPNTAAPLS